MSDEASRRTDGMCATERGVFLYVTFPADADIPAFAKRALAENLCACVNVLTSRSIYLWEGEVKDEPEQVALFKTAPGNEQALRRYIEANHPYTVPCIATLTPGLNPSFADWLDETTGSA